MITLPVTLTPLRINLIINLAQSASTWQITKNSETIKQPKDFLKEKILGSICLDPPSTKKSYARKNKAVEHNNIQPFFLKAARHVIASHLSSFLNFVFAEEILARNCKIARITPIYKSRAEEINIYRLLSILNCFLKIMKKFLFVRLNSFSKNTM